MLLGLGIGAVTALLLAPQSGEVSTEQIRARLDEVLAAGRRAQQTTEDELQTRWEATVSENGKPPAEPMSADKRRAIKAEEAEARAREKAEAARKDAERHLEKAGKELEKARTKL